MGHGNDSTSRLPWLPTMPAKNPFTTEIILWGVVNIVNIAQSIGFFSRTGGGGIQSMVGILVMILAVPAGVVIWRDVTTGEPLWKWIGALVFILFAVVELFVDYILKVEFRQPPRTSILAPYLILFFGSILLMGIRMYPVSKPLWGVTALTAVLLIASMLWAQAKGVG